MKKYARCWVVGGLLAVVGPLTASESAFADGTLEQGKKVYEGNGACFSCHGALGMGDGAAAAALTPKPASFVQGVFKYDSNADGKTGTEADLFDIVTNGAGKYGGSPMMIGRPDLPEADRKAVVKYVLSLKQ